VPTSDPITGHQRALATADPAKITIDSDINNQPARA